MIIPRSSPVTPELLAGLGRHVDTARLSEAQVAALAIAHSGYDVDQAVLRRLGLSPSAARKGLADLVTLGLLRSRRARGTGPYRLGMGPDADSQPSPAAQPQPPLPRGPVAAGT